MLLRLPIFLMLVTVPVWAAAFDPDQPFEQGFTNNLLRSLLNQAFDALEGHIEITGHVDPDDVKGHRRGNLRFKFYPEGKSTSDHHLTVEGWFHFSPETGQQDWHFRFKLPEARAQKSLLPFEEPL
jgi:hypothetical protein